MKRIILHCDLNNFYASVECVKNPALKGRAVAVCGSDDDRHGIVLAKSQPAKICGVKTGDTIFEAKKKCNDLVIVQTDFDAYHQYSEIVKEIYSKYTDLIEPFGMDECWLDASGSTILFGEGKKIADEIRERVKTETGLTISVGVSFNKIFAKLGSDMKKPDATTVISRDNFKDKIWNLNVSELLFVGRQTTKTLNKYGIRTIGDIALSESGFMRKILGKNGYDLWLYANGMDTSPVSHIDSKPVVKSVSRGITCVESLFSVYEIRSVFAELCKSVAKALRNEHLLATAIQIAIKDDSLTVKQYSSPLEFPTHSARELFDSVMDLFSVKHQWNRNIRALTVRTFNLVNENNFQQLFIGYDIDTHEKCEQLDSTLIQIRKEQGGDMLFNGCRLLGTKMPAGKSEYSALPPASF